MARMKGSITLLIQVSGNISSRGANVEKNLIAADLGAESGRVILGRFDGERIDLEELHRFPNRQETIDGSLH